MISYNKMYVGVFVLKKEEHNGMNDQTLFITLELPKLNC